MLIIETDHHITQGFQWALTAAVFLHFTLEETLGMTRRNMPGTFISPIAIVGHLVAFLTVFSVAVSRKSDGLVITHMTVPDYVHLGSDVTLQCLYDHGGDPLYSLKWYKGSHEFFRYIPSGEPQFLVFSWSTFNISYDSAEPGKVYFKEVNRQAEGRYKCEISLEGPTFETEFREKDLTVYDVNSDGPVLYADAANELKAGEHLRFTCSFHKSRPKPILSWFVDGVEIVDKREIRYVMETFPEHESGDNALDWWSADTELNVLPSAWQLQRTWLTVACRATVLNGTVYQRVVSMNFTNGMTPPPVQHVQRVRPSSSVSSGGQQHQVSASVASSQHNSFSHSSSNKGPVGSNAPAGRPLVIRLELWLFVVGMSATLLS